MSARHRHGDFITDVSAYRRQQYFHRHGISPQRWKTAIILAVARLKAYTMPQHSFPLALLTFMSTMIYKPLSPPDYRFDRVLVCKSLRSFPSIDAQFIPLLRMGSIFADMNTPFSIYRFCYYTIAHAFSRLSPHAISRYTSRRLARGLRRSIFAMPLFQLFQRDLRRFLSVD